MSQWGWLAAAPMPLCAAVWEQGCPSRPVRLVVPAPMRMDQRY